MMDKLKAMAVFIKTVECGSFRAAATALHLSPSVVSYHVQTLEKNLGVALLYRTTRKLSLSPEGKVLFESGQKMLSEMFNAFDLLTDKTDTPQGELRISLPSALIGSALSQAIAQFSLSYPQVQLHLSNSDKAKDIMDSEFDMFIRIGGQGSDGGKRKNLFDLQRSLVASPEYLSRQGWPQSIADLKNAQWIGLSQLPNQKILIDNNGKKEHIDYTPCITTDSVQDMAVLCRNGLGLSTPPTFMIQNDLEKNKLSMLLTNYQVQPLTVYAQWPASRYPSKLTQRFLIFINQYLERRPENYF